jgi:hypothetical protein
MSWNLHQHLGLNTMSLILHQHIGINYHLTNTKITYFAPDQGESCGNSNHTRSNLSEFAFSQCRATECGTRSTAITLNMEIFIQMKQHMHKNIDIRKLSLPSVIFALLLIASTSLLAKAPSDKAAFSIISQSAQYMDIQFVLPDYEIKQEQRSGTNFQKIIMPDAEYLIEEGMPELPTMSTLIAIPMQGSAYVEVLDSRTKVLNDITPFPVQNDESGNTDFAINTDYYNGSKSISNNAVQYSDPRIMRDFRVVNVQIEPFVWDAASHELAVREEISLRLHFSDEPGINELSAPPRVSAEFDKIYSSLILNYDDYRSGLITNTPPRIVMLHGEYTDPSFLSFINNFAFWKRQKGADVTLLSTAVTGTSNTAIKNHLQGLYDNPVTRFDYLVIIGDVTGSFAVPGWYTADGFGDYPYQMLAGNDQLGDVFIGRISAENTMQLYVILSKIYAYERDINVENAQHLDRMLLAADTTLSGASIRNLSYFIKEISERVNPDYTYTILAQNQPNPPDMNMAINQGVGFFNYRGYGGMSGWSPTDSNLYNINKLFHSVIITCNTGNYDTTATTEQLIRIGTAASPKGAVTSIGMWGSGTATMPNNALCGGIYSGIFLNDMRTMGQAFLYTKLHFASLYGISNPGLYSAFTQWCNLMGDPTMEIYITIPQTFSSNAPASVAAGVNSLDISVLDQDGFPVSNATLTVTHTQDSRNIIVSRGYTDENGMAYLPFSEEITSSDLILTISKHDFKPLQQTIAVEAGSLLASVPMIDDDLQGASAGNGNGSANSGETLEVIFGLRNTATAAIDDIGGYITCDSPYVTIVDSLLDFGSILPGTNGSSTNPVVMQISAETPNNTLLRFSMHLLDGDDNQYTIADYISVTDAELRYTSYEIVDGANSVLDPGETAQINLSVLNIGELPLENLMGELFTDNDMVAVLDSLGSFGSIAMNASASTTTDNFSVQGRISLLPGMIIPMRLKLSNPSGFRQWLHFSITVGTVTVNDPLGPDRYGYVIYDEGDTAYDECPVYDWIGIAPAEGGSGTLLNIIDPQIPTEGDDVDSVSLAWVDLPFTFRFYGDDYQDISISSNGVITFGHTDNPEFRNYRIPGPMGPSPMIAAFWDDLATGPNSQVCTWFDEETHTFIVEWYQMLNGYDNDYLETFQVILYDPAYYPTTFGDGPIKIQYHTFNNVNSGATYQNHGNFCTVGIESTDHLDGLEYTFMNTYPVAALPLGHESAIYITKRPEYFDNPFLVLGDIVLNDSNNVAEPGETLELGLHLQNLGNLAATDVNATLRIRDPYVTLINGNSEYHPIDGHSDGVNLDPFTFTISSSCPVNHSIELALDVSEANRAWTHTFNIDVKQPGLVYDTFYLNDADGNNNGVAEPGESFIFVVNVANRSDVAALNIIGQLTSTSNSITIDNPLISLAILEADELGQFAFEASLSPDALINHTIPLSFTLSSANAPTINADIALGCGSMGMNSDFENGPGGLESQGGWEWGTSQQIEAYSGNNIWGTALNEEYENGANYYLTSEPIFIGTGAYLSFWHQLHCQDNFDGGNVSVSTNNGASWYLIYPSSGSSYTGTVYSMNEPGFTTDILNWTNVSFDLAAFANNEIRIRWHFTSDGSVSSYGWFIDDVTVTGFATKAGWVNGSVSLSDNGDPSLAKISIPMANATVIANPDTTGAYAAYLPQGTYSITASKPYHISQSSPEFVINEQSLEYSYDFNLISLPAVSDFTLDHEEDEPSVTLYWTAPIDPVYPVQAYKVYRKTGPGLVEEITELTNTSYSEDSLLTGTYSYHVRPVYSVGEGAPSDTLEVQILPPQSGEEDQISTIVNSLHPNSPNPFNPATTISLDLAKAGHTQLKIYNLKGQLVKSLINQHLAAGHHRLLWDGMDSNNRRVASGVYLYRLETDGFVKTRKMLLMK